MRPADALDLQVLARDRFGSRGYHQYLTGFCASTYKKLCESSEMAVAGADVLSERLVNGLRYADAYFVSGGMMAVTEHLAEQDSPGLTVDRSALPSDFGWIVLEQVTVIHDQNLEPCTVRAILWRQTSGTLSPDGEHRLSPGIELYLFAHMDDDGPGDAIVRDLNSQQYDEVRRKSGPFHLLHVGVLPYGKDLTSFQTPASHPEIFTTVSNGYLDRFVYLLISLMNQPLPAILVETEDSDRNQAKRMRRANLPGRVTVVRLRRLDPQPRVNTQPTIEWQHRWMVKGHNRTYHRGTDREFTVYVEPYAKGPEDKPWMQSKKVYALVR